MLLTQSPRAALFTSPEHMLVPITTLDTRAVRPTSSGPRHADDLDADPRADRHDDGPNEPLTRGHGLGWVGANVG